MAGEFRNNATDTTPMVMYTISPDVLFQEVNGEVVALSMATGSYYGMNEMASQMWHLIRQHKSIDAVVAALLEEFDVSEAQLREDTSKFVEQLLSKGMLIEERE